MIDTLSDPALVGHLVVSIPEEMPLVESLELRGHLVRIFPRAEVAFVLNRRFPAPAPLPNGESEIFPEDRPFAVTAREHAGRKAKLERENLELWAGIPFSEIPYLAPPAEKAFDSIVEKMTEVLRGSLA